MKKLRMTSPDLTEANIDKLAELFPSVITETLDADGNLQRAVDFDLLRQELSDQIVEGPQERYRLDWPGKRAAAFAANAPIAKTLRPMREESVDFDTTKNLFIEGDNLDALKLLQESYLGKVKLIYIDPPYNTGNDFVYADDFSESSVEYLIRSGQSTEAGERLTANSEANGRFHSDWLSMMYPRLKLARGLLSDDGVIFISIDDHEGGNLRKLCDDVFGARNFIAQFVWKSRKFTDTRAVTNVSTDHEYIVAYGRTSESALRGVERDESKFANPDDDPRGPWMSRSILGLATRDQRPNLHFDLVDPTTGIVYPPNPNTGWRYSSERMAQMVSERRILFPSRPGGRPREKKFRSEMQTDLIAFRSVIDEVYTADGTSEVRDLLGSGIFAFPKPTALIEELIRQGTDSDSLVLDFFAGSATTGDAVYRLNSEDGGTRRFILVQLDEEVSTGSDVARAGFSTIADVSRERLRKASSQSSRTLGANIDTLDLGFRSLHVDTTNMMNVLRSADDTDQLSLDELQPSIKLDRTSEDLLFQVLLDWGLELTMPITMETLGGHQVFDVEDGSLVACFDTQIGPDIVREIAQRKPLRAVFRDDGFGSDAARVNAEQVFREVSPATEVKVI
ncbi:site-specific DNA-methyltransferase [Propionibacterium freudenreichii]|uniref:site-specific DNA-methyltransferase n=1 Tax=Propionibacterium freudenreichii TaxID=1744 RepID=UPI00254FBC5B|nr:site-specific DNA-methyltransferase [Propionibacterium freudenreichii]MDK9640952.1 site-specific DNA-methyltransferase [Propionibacterium freudenreichii]